MAQGPFPYLKKKHSIALTVLAVPVLVIFFILVFTPFRIHDWVNAYRLYLMWGEMLLLLAVIAVLAAELNTARQELRLWEQGTAQEKKEQDGMYKFYDEKGDLKLLVRPEMLFYLEAADNYVQIHYMNAGKMEKIMIRNTLKNIEWRFRDHELVRCHRSFIVNLANVKLLKRTEGDVLIDFGDERIARIPVSKGYGDKVLERFAQ
jgi:DNA-binding LytR/AlgR family response regulator